MVNEQKNIQQFVQRRRHGIYLNTFHLNTHPNVWFALLIHICCWFFIRFDSHCQSNGNGKWYGLQRYGGFFSLQATIEMRTRL